jgi:hypothetical protein
MKTLFALVLILLASNAFGVTARHSAAENQTRVTTVAQVLHATSGQNAACSENVKLAWNPSSDTPSFGETYCRKMAVCCDAGSVSCCANYNKFCNP